MHYPFWKPRCMELAIQHGLKEHDVFEELDILTTFELHGTFFNKPTNKKIQKRTLKPNHNITKYSKPGRTQIEFPGKD